MSFDFTTVFDRRGHDSIAAEVIPFPDLAVKEGFDPIPMWVADMSFATAPSVLEALKNRLTHPAFGYFNPSEAYKNALLRWQKGRNGVDLTWETIGYDHSVLGGIVSAANATTARGGKILIHSPTYVGFTGALTNNGYQLIYGGCHPSSSNNPSRRHMARPPSLV
jgi:cystathionine beta-lyase